MKLQIEAPVCVEFSVTVFEMQDEEILNKLNYVLPRIQREYGCKDIEFVIKSVAVNEEEGENETFNKGCCINNFIK